MAKSGTKSSVGSTAGKSRSRSTAKNVVSSRRGRPTEASGDDITVVPRGAKLKGETDWAAVDAMTDAEIEAAAASDPDAVPLGLDWSDAVWVMPPKKKAISIRLDPDVLDFFKEEGPGYQRRINQVLRTYVEHRKKAG